MNPMLWGVKSYLSPGLPSPATIKSMGEFFCSRFLKNTKTNHFENREIEDENVVQIDDPGKLSDFSSSLYTILLTAATAVTIIIGIVLGIKYMVGSVEEKAEYKKMLVPYLAGCVAIYGALGIWKLLVTILSGI